MSKVTCRYCKNKIDKDKSYSVEYLTSSLSIRKKYYCNEKCCEKEEKAKQDKIRLKEIEVNARNTVREILGIGSDKNIYFSKMYKDLKDTFGDKTIYDYIMNERMKIEFVLNSKDFKTTNSKVKYFFAMAQNNLEYYKCENNESKNVVETKREFDIDDFDVTDIVVTKKKRSIDDILKNM